MALTKVSRGLLSTGIVDNSNATAITIDSSENVLVGTTSLAVSSSTGSVTGSVINTTGLFEAAKTGTVMELNRLTDNGTILNFRKDGTTVGSINNFSSTEFGLVSEKNLVLTQNTTTERNLVFSSSYFGSFGADDATIDLGRSVGRFKDLYLSGGVFLGGTASANKLEDYEEGTWTMTLTSASTAPTISITNTTGNYTKIGNLVHVRIYTGAMNITGAGSGGVRIGGLPFVVTTSASAYSAASFAHTNCFTTEVEAYGAVGNNFVVAVQPNSITNAAYEVANPRYLMFSLVYQTNE